MRLPVKSLLLVSACACASAPAFARTEIHPYIEAQQILDAQLKNGNDVLTYSTLGAGVDVSMEGQRTTAEVAYRYERRFGWGKNADNGDYHSGLARAAYQIVPNALSIEAGAIATRARSDIRGAAPSLFGNNGDNVTQVYQAYAGPTLSTHVGALDVGAAYRVAYTATDGGNFTPAAGQPRLDSYDNSMGHAASASVGMAPGKGLPFGWNVSGAYTREDANQLDQRFEQMGVRGEVIYPVTATVSLVGGVGYENIESSQRSALLDATGNPVLTPKGRFVTNKASPRVLGYDFDGIYWDVGAQWRPSRRTSLEFAVGKRYGSMTYSGSASWQASEHSALQLGVYDQVDTFGGQLNRGVRGLPSNFNRPSTGIGQQFGGCTFGGGGEGGGQLGGGCLNNTLNGINTGAFRSRGAALQWAAEHGRATYGLGIGYENRKFLTPNIPGVYSVNGLSDENWFAEGNFGYQLSRRSTFDAGLYANYSDPGIAGAPNVLSTGATGAYTRQFGRSLSAHAALGLYSYDVEGDGSDMNASAQVGVRYSF